MKIVGIIFGLFVIAGVVLAILERRRGKAFLKHDLRKNTPTPYSTSQATGLTTIFPTGSNNGSHQCATPAATLSSIKRPSI